MRLLTFFSLLLFSAEYSKANNSHHIFRSYPFQEAELVGDVDREEFDKAWNTYNLNWTPLELFESNDNENAKRVTVTNCRELDSYSKKGWLPVGFRYINLASSYGSVCAEVDLLAKTKALASDEERKRLRVIPQFERIVFRTLPYYWTPFDEHFPQKLKGNVTIGQLIKSGRIQQENIRDNVIKISFDDKEILIIEVASARFLETNQIKTLVVFCVSDHGALRFKFPQLVSMDAETGLMYCEGF